VVGSGSYRPTPGETLLPVSAAARDAGAVSTPTAGSPAADPAGPTAAGPTAAGPTAAAQAVAGGSVPVGGLRLPWSEVPAWVRGAVEERLGAAVVEAVTQPGGFSPGAAARLRLADGSRAFAKAVSVTINPFSPDMHRTEADTAELLPPGTPSPRLRFRYDDGEWVVLVFDDVEGRQPALPWRADELTAVTAALTPLSRLLTPCPVPFAPPVAQLLAEDFASWRRFAGGPAHRLADLSPWARRHLDRLAGLEASWTAQAGGDTLTHMDLRADNLLLTPDGHVVVVDWAWPCRAAPWLDLVVLLASVRAQSSLDTDGVLREHPSTRDVDPAAVDAVLAGLAGLWTDRSRQPAPPRMPTLRAFQAAHGRATRQWLAARRGWD
jgi:Phosphotransferase enzyme family